LAKIQHRILEFLASSLSNLVALLLSFWADLICSNKKSVTKNYKSTISFSCLCIPCRLFLNWQ
jgi:hypothetical protein